MYIKNKTISFLWKLVIALLGTYALLEQIGLFSGELNTRFICFFTNISNIAVVAYLYYSLATYARKDTFNTPKHPKLKYALMLAITVTFLVAHFMLDGGMVFQNGQFRLTMLILHYLVPIGFILDWILFDEKGSMQKFDPLYWPAFPLVYLVYIAVLVEGVGLHARADSRWPYPFIDVDMLGIPTVLLTIVVLLVVFIALGYVYVAIDKALTKRIHKQNL